MTPFTKMDRGDQYSEKLNELLSGPGSLERKLQTAVQTFKTQIDELKSTALLTPECELTTLYRNHVDLISRLSDYTSSAEVFERKLVELFPVSQTICHKAKDAIAEYDLARRNVNYSCLAEFVDFYDSEIDAARLLDDQELIIDALQRYLTFIYDAIADDPRCSNVLLENTNAHQNCLDTLARSIVSFEDLLRDMKFPASPSTNLDESPSQVINDEYMKAFATSYQCLASLRIPHINFLLSKPLSDVVCLPMQIILRPLEKRFRYHFTGDRKTNRLDKPEWYMTQVLQWIRENDYVLTVMDRDFLTDGKYKMRTEFMRGLVVLIMDKLKLDLGLSPTMNARYAVEFNLRDSSIQNTEATAVNHINPAQRSTSHSKDAMPHGLLLENVDCFSNLIDVLLQTDARLMQLAYPSDQPRPTELLTLPRLSAPWIMLEQQLALTRLHALLDSASAWNVVDENSFRPQCVDDFMALFHAVGCRGRQIGDKLTRTRVLRVQLHLCRTYHTLLGQQLLLHYPSSTSLPHPSGTGATTRGSDSIASRITATNTTLSQAPFQSLFTRLRRTGTRSSSNPGLSSSLSSFVLNRGAQNPSIVSSIGARWISVMNGLSCLRDALMELANDPYYVTFWEDSTLRAYMQVADPWMEDLGLEGYPEFEAVMNRNLSNDPDAMDSMMTTTVDGLHGGIFHQISLELRSTLDSMLRETILSVMSQVTRGAQAYIRATDYWLRAGSVPGITGGVNVDSSSLDLTGSASTMLVCIRDSLFGLHKSLEPSLFSLAWQGVARATDDLIYEQLIQTNRFTPAGAAQLLFDLTHYVFPQFTIYAHHRRPESYFAQSRDAIVILCLLRGSAELLRITLDERLSGRPRASADGGTGSNNPLGPLQELGVYSLTPEEARRVLDLRASPD